MPERIKTELFYIREMLRYGYWHPRYWFAYFKNRFFWPMLIGNIKPISYAPDDDFEIHILIQGRDLWMLVWSVKSFLKFSELKPKLIIHDDGSLGDKAMIVKKIFPDAVILGRREAGQALLGVSGYSDIVKDFRERGHAMTIKFIDVAFLARGKYVMTLDSDILFFRRPQLIIDFVSGRLDYNALISGVPQGSGEFKVAVAGRYLDEHGLNPVYLSRFNAGLVAYRRDRLDLSWIEEYLENVKLPPEDYFLEMTGWCCLIGRINHKILPPDEYVLKGKLSDATIMKHFTSPRRHEMFAWGIDAVRRIMGE